MTRRLPKFALALASGLLALAAAEFGLRLSYATLPSHAALEGSEWSVGQLAQEHHPAFDLGTLSGRCAEDLGIARSVDLRSQHGQPEGTSVELWTLGDSVVAGAEVARQEAFPVLLGDGLARGGERSVQVNNLAIPGSSLCGRARQLAALAAEPERPDLLLVVVGSDDMDDYRMFAYQDRLVVPADPATIGNSGLAALVSHSYLANLAWYGWAQRRYETSRRLAHGDCVDWARRVFDQLHSLGLAADLPLQVVLLPAPGLAHCTPAPAGDDMCSTLSDGQAILAEALVASELIHHDLSDIWPTAAVREPPGQGMVQVHPDPQGHARIADRVLPILERELDQ